MKIDEIINETPVEEAPVSGIRQLGRKAASYGLSKVGAKGAARVKGRQIDVDGEANRIKDDLKTTIKGAGERMKDLDVNYFKNFLGQAGFDDEDISAAINKFAPKGELDNKSIDKSILALVRKASKQQASTQRSKFATRAKGDTSKAKGNTSKARGRKGPNIPTGTIMKASDKRTYEWKGAQWVDTQNNRTAERRIAKELTAKFG